MAKIIGLHAVYASPKGDFDTTGHFNKDHKKQLNSMMEIAEKQCEKAGVKFDQKIVYGNPGYEIAKFANLSKNKIDMVVIGSRGRSSAKEIFFWKYIPIRSTQIKTFCFSNKIAH